jgi:hypothetical protein
MDATALRDETTLIRQLADKQEIAEVIYRRARAGDRKDMPLALSCYHSGATEDHEGFNGLAEDFIRNRSLLSKPADGPVKTLWHFISNILVEFTTADAAAVESYHIAVLVIRDDKGERDVTIGGRYLDRFERREGRWAISHREVVFDWSRVEPATRRYWDDFDGAKFLFGRFDTSDPLYTHLLATPAQR